MGLGVNANGQLGDGTTTRRTTPVQVLGPGGAGTLSGVQRISARNHTVAVMTDGTVWAWGDNEYGQLGDGSTVNRTTPVQVVGPGGAGFLTGVRSVGAGLHFTVAVKNDGTVWAWGGNWGHTLGDGTSTSSTTPVQVVGQGGTGFLTGIEAVSSYQGHTVALATDGAAWAWGGNVNGLLGDGTTTVRDAPIQVVDADGIGFFENVQEIRAGDSHTIAVKTDGTVWSWGRGQYGQLGDGSSGYSKWPVHVLGPKGMGFLEVPQATAASRTHSVALMTDGTVWAWGDNGSGQLGNGTGIDSKTPIQVLGPGGAGVLDQIIAIAAGYSPFNVALKGDGTVWTWGQNIYGQLGYGLTGGRTTPVQVKGLDGVGYLTGIQAVSAGDSHTVALKTDGTVWAWGQNHMGQLGDGTETDSTTPVQVVGPGGSGVLTDVRYIEAGYSYTVVIKTDDTVWAWGDNSSGQLGDGTNTDRKTPVQVVGVGGTGYLTDITMISAGWEHTVALKTDGGIVAWGLNQDGQLGDGTTIFNRKTPAPVVGPDGTGIFTDALMIVAGNSHTVALRADDTVWTWGRNFWGQLGNGRLGEDTVPGQVIGPDGNGFLTGVTAVAAGSSHTIAIQP